MINAKPHILVINRWREKYADYDRYVDHAAHHVTYVTTEVGLGSVPATAAATALVPKTDDLAAARAAVAELVVRFGRPAGVVALKEDDLLVGAQLRQEYGCPGPTPADLAVFRDKYLMCRAIRDAGLPVPDFAAAGDEAAVRRMAATHGWPVILKPRIGSSSEGVVRLDGPAALAEVTLDREPMLVQQFRTDPIHHVDGVFDGRSLTTWRASRYLHSCLDFRGGGVLGSVEVDDPEVNAAIGAAARRFLAALTGAPVVFHLEVFVGRTATGRPYCSFLEVGARAGGAEIPFLWREVHGYDLMEAAWRIQLGEAPQPPRVPAGAGSGEVAGWLLAAAPAARPCRVTEATRMVGRDPGPYAEVVLRPGEVLPAADAFYEHVGGRFRFRGATGGAVEAAIRATAGDFRVAGEPVTQSLISS
jgi:biotin carboxylase